MGYHKGRYWAEVRRTEPESKIERQHETRFGPHWAVDKVKRPPRREYSTSCSPYEPRTGYAGVWKGRTAPVGKAAPRRWAAEPPGIRPYGLRPYEAKLALLVESKAITDRLRLSDDPYSCQRLRDFREHIRERANERSGPYWDEMAAIDLYRRHDQLRWCLDAGDDEECPDSGPGRDTFIAVKNGLQFQEVDNTIAKRRKRYNRPLRERRKVGRKPIGLIAQTSAERARKYRRNRALSKTLATHERIPAGTDQPMMPLGLAVPTALSTRAQGGDTT